MDNDCNGIVDDGGDALCDNGLFCDGAETCGGVDLCQAGTPPDCDDGISCTDDACNEGTDSCDNAPDDGLCDNGLFCDGAESCDSALGCQQGGAPCASDETCEEPDMCVAASAGFCAFDHEQSGLSVQQCEDLLAGCDPQKAEITCSLNQAVCSPFCFAPGSGFTCGLCQAVATANCPDQVDTQTCP